MDQLFNPARLVIGFVVLFAIFVPLETLFPLVRRQFWQRRGVGADVTHFFITGAIRKLLTLFAAYGLITLAAVPGEPAARWLPVPAVYLIGRDGRVKFVHTNPDYKARLSAEQVLAAAQAAL